MISFNASDRIQRAMKLKRRKMTSNIIFNWTELFSSVLLTTKLQILEQIKQFDRWPKYCFLETQLNLCQKLCNQYLTFFHCAFLNIFKQLQLNRQHKYCFLETQLNWYQNFISFQQFSIKSKGNTLINRNSLWRKFQEIDETPENLWYLTLFRVES